MTATAIAATIRQQIELGVLMSLGARDLAYTTAGEKPGFTFKATVLPFRKDGTRGTRGRTMRVTITFSPVDDYTVTVGYLNRYEWVEHFRTEGVYADALNRVLLSIDSDDDRA